MSKRKIKAPYQCMDLKEYKLFDFVPEFSKYVNLMIFHVLVVKILIIIS